MVGIKDVAAVAGVSDRTVSRVVHNDKRVDAATRARVSDAIVQLGYVPNRGALLMRHNRSGVIGVMTDVVSTTPYSTDIIRGIQAAIEKTDFSILTVNTAGHPEQARRCWRELKGHRVDAVIFVTMFQRQLAPGETDPSVKTILVNCHPEPGTELPHILPDEALGMDRAVDAAVAAGHRKIGYVRLNPTIMAADIRETALRRALARHDLALPAKWCLSGAEGPIFRDKFVAFDTVTDLLRQPESPSVLFCGNDEIALQAFSAAAGLGLRVPSDISLIGFDDFTVVTEIMRPTLSTVALPYFDMGRKAVELVQELIEGPVATLPYLTACHYISRESLRDMNP
jgi:LacI family transcriptional regulator